MVDEKLLAYLEEYVTEDRNISSFTITIKTSGILINNILIM